MSELTSLLPKPQFSEGPRHSESAAPQVRKKVFVVPKYGHRQGFVPRRPEDFGDGGAFPEVDVPQYPLGMGLPRPKTGTGVLGYGGGRVSNTVALTTDGQGNVNYEAIAKHKHDKDRKVYASHDALVPAIMKGAGAAIDDVDPLAKPSEDEVEAVTEATRNALQAKINAKLAAAKPVSAPEGRKSGQLVRYTPAQQGDAYASGAKNRLISMVEIPVDPLEPPKFRTKKVPRGPGSPPPPVLHSPPRKLTVKDQQDWKIPPCISNWKNSKGYTIPLDKRLAADGRGLQETTVNDNFAKLAESLYVAERNAREELDVRARMGEVLRIREKEKREEELKRMALRAREERAGITQPLKAVDEDEANERDEIRADRKRQREHEKRLDNAAPEKRSKLLRDRDRDITEKIALGMARAGSNEVQYDSRLFNQDQGTSSGYGPDDTYNLYDKALFSGSSANVQYRPKAPETNAYADEDAAAEAVMKTSRFKPPSATFAGGEGGAPERGEHKARQAPVDFEEDPFGLDSMFKEAKEGRRGALDHIGKRGALAAGGGGIGSGGGTIESYQKGGDMDGNRDISYKSQGLEKFTTDDSAAGLRVMGDGKDIERSREAEAQRRQSEREAIRRGQDARNAPVIPDKRDRDPAWMPKDDSKTAPSRSRDAGGSGGGRGEQHDEREAPRGDRDAERSQRGGDRDAERSQRGGDRDAERSQRSDRDRAPEPPRDRDGRSDRDRSERDRGDRDRSERDRGDRDRSDQHSNRDQPRRDAYGRDERPSDRDRRSRRSPSPSPPRGSSRSGGAAKAQSSSRSGRRSSPSPPKRRSASSSESSSSSSPSRSRSRSPPRRAR